GTVRLSFPLIVIPACAGATSWDRALLLFWYQEHLAGIDQVGVADMAAIGLVDHRVAGAFSIALAREEPEAVARLDRVAAAGRHRHRLGRRRIGLGDALGLRAIRGRDFGAQLET